MALMPGSENTSQMMNPMSRTLANRTRPAQTTRPPQRMNPTRGMSEELPTEAKRDVSPTRREPIRGECYTMFHPDETKRQAIQRADEEKRKAEEYKRANRPHYSYVGTVGGGESSSSGASATAVTQRKLPAQGSNLTPLQKAQKYKEEEKLRKEKEHEKMKQTQRQKTIENEKRDREREERLRADHERAKAAFLDNFEGKSSGNARGKPSNASSSASASGGVKEENEMPEFVYGLRQLEAMFPSVEKEVLKSLLKEAENNVDEVVEFLS